MPASAGLHYNTKIKQVPRLLIGGSKNTPKPTRDALSIRLKIIHTR